ncbi:hypothetical protein K493DRAFT_337237 [Basidiobolus meristosporus CBS 931.73]|uniref:RGS domain-containing protein n=1 Tax=Basidiobolus meristosporus CBS 931.73 TaxID=1314790 RepID=A0A1Y1YD66_9FUNG|nr:hypothetical protein K493DRAFT_337237 [Basidiobolus meristosporus CBS 931.73]|eukprot:ORX95676.1 hypothetical protein K493DRAFT_337237 [Basidiobolus meristosporus CBS 931.73]
MLMSPKSTKENGHLKNHTTAPDASQMREISRGRSSLLYSQPSISTEAHFDHLVESERRMQRSRFQKIRCQRTSSHIFSYIRIYAQVNNQCFAVTSSRTNTIDVLARQIEAEYAFNCSSGLVHTSAGRTAKYESPGIETVSQLSGYEERDPFSKLVAPLICGSLFVDQVELRFADLVGEVLNMNDIVRVVNVYEEFRPTRKNSDNDSSGWSLHRSRNSHYNQFSKSLEERFQETVWNEDSLSEFQVYCLREYAIEKLLFWIEVELLHNARASLVPNIAQYIYHTYVARDAPLQVNLCDDIQNEISVSFSSEEGIPVSSTFDEAQEYVYELLKQHTFRRFEESTPYKVRSKQGRAGYTLIGKVLDMELIEEVMADLQANAGNIDSNWFKESILRRILYQYFPECPSLGGDYFCNETKLSLAQKSRKIKSEKKLTKFFGHRLTKQELTQQQEALNVPSQEMAIATTSLPSDTLTDAEKKKKLGKLEKLEGFFGKRLTNDQLEYQNLINDTEVHLPPECSERNGSAKESILPVSTYNDLSLEERRVLTRRSKKLRCLLGESIDEQTTFKALTYPIINGKCCFETNAQLDATDASPTSDVSSQPKATSKDAKRKKLIKLYQLLGTYPSEDSLGNKPSSAKDLARNRKSLSPEIKRILLKRANKLERVFGKHPPNEMIVDESTDGLPTNRTDTPPGLEDLGPSVEELIEYLQVLALLSDNDLQLVEGELQDNDRARSAPSSFKAQERTGFSHQTLEDLSDSKTIRQKKLAKLRRIFGNDPSVESLITQNILLRQQLANEGLYNLPGSCRAFDSRSLDEISTMSSESLLRTAFDQELDIFQGFHRRASSTFTIDSL